MLTPELTSWHIMTALALHFAPTIDTSHALAVSAMEHTLAHSELYKFVPARKLRLALDRPRMVFGATQISPTHLKPHKVTVFDTDPLQCVFWRISQRNSVVIDPNLRSAPQGHSFGLETGTYGHHSVRAGALDAQIGAQNPQLVGSKAPGPLQAQVWFV